MSELTGDQLVRAMHEAAIARATPIFDVPDLAADHPLAQEWKTFKREVFRLVDAGERGRFVLIKGDRVISTWDTERDAHQAARERFGEGPFLVQEVQLHIKVIRPGGIPRVRAAGTFRLSF